MNRTLWNRAEIRLWGRLNTPRKIQDYLDQLRYNFSGPTRSPREALKVRKAHCFDGALIAAAALEYQGEPPLILDLRAVRDDDHIITVFKRSGRYGSIAKSNYSGLRYREPVYSSLRELAISYFESYFNLKGEKSLREYSRLIDLRTFKANWRTSPEPLDYLGEKIDSVQHYPIMPKGHQSYLSKVDKRSYQAGLLGRQKG